MKSDEFSSYIPGLSIDEIREKYRVRNIIKLASNENPLGTSPLVRDTIKKYASFAFRYPRSGNIELVEEISKKLGLKKDNIVVGNGSDELIDLIIRLNSGTDRNIILFDPSFSIYELQAKLCGVEIKKIPLNRDFSFPLERVIEAIDKNTAIVFLTNPDNPSGYAVKKFVILDFLNHIPEDVLVVVDEAYVDFTEEIKEYSLIDQIYKFNNLVVLRTFSKAYGLAGLRLGFGVMSEKLADVLRKIKLPFSVNILAEKAAIMALKDIDFYNLTLETVKKGRDFLSKGLKDLDCYVYPSKGNFIMFKPPIDAEFVYKKLLKKGIIIRYLKSYNLPELLRVSIGNSRENKLFLDGLKEIIKGRIYYPPP